MCKYIIQSKLLCLYSHPEYSPNIPECGLILPFSCIPTYDKGFRNEFASNEIFLFQVEKIVTIMSNPRQYKIPDWFLNRQKDIKDGKYSQVRFIFLLLESHYIVRMMSY